MTPPQGGTPCGPWPCLPGGFVCPVHELEEAENHG